MSILHQTASGARVSDPAQTLFDNRKETPFATSARPLELRSAGSLGLGAAQLWTRFVPPRVNNGSQVFAFCAPARTPQPRILGPCAVRRGQNSRLLRGWSGTPISRAILIPGTTSTCA